MHLEMTWLVGTVVSFIWTGKIIKKRKCKLDQLIGHLQLQYRANQNSRNPRFAHIIGI
jgi:hypothetical protein